MGRCFVTETHSGKGFFGAERRRPVRTLGKRGQDVTAMDNSSEDEFDSRSVRTFQTPRWHRRSYLRIETPWHFGRGAQGDCERGLAASRSATEEGSVAAGLRARQGGPPSLVQ